MIEKEPRRRSFFLSALPLFVLAHFAHHLLTALPVPMLPFIRNEFGLNYTQSSLVVSSFSLAYGLGQLPAGWFTDRIGPRISITIGICGVALAGVLVGLSQVYIMLIVFLVVMGLTAGGYHPAASPLISASVEPGKRGRALGFHLIGGGGSFFLSPIIAGAIASVWGWRGSFLGLAVPTVLFGLFFYWFLGRHATVRTGPAVPSPNLPDAAPTPGRVRSLVSFIILSVFTTGVVNAVIAFVPLYMVDHYGTSEKTGAFFVAIIYSAGLWAGPLGGYLADRLGKVKLILVINIVSCAAVYLLNLAPYGLAVGALLLVTGITLYMRMAISETYIIGKTTARRRSMVYGFYYCMMMESGALLAPVMGIIVDHYGFSPGFTAVSIAALAVTLICLLFLRGSHD